MPKFVVTIIHDKLVGQTTIEAKDEAGARYQAEMEGYIVKDVALQMPDSPSAVPAAAATRTNAAPAASIKDQLLTATAGFPAIALLGLGARGSPPGLLLGGMCLAITYFIICRPRHWSNIWSPYQKLCLFFSLFVAAAVVGNILRVTSPGNPTILDLAGILQVPAMCLSAPGQLLVEILPIFIAIDPQKHFIGVAIQIATAIVLLIAGVTKVPARS